MRKALRRDRKTELAYYDLLDRSYQKIGSLGFKRSLNFCRAHPDTGMHAFKEGQSAYQCRCGLAQAKAGVKIVRYVPSLTPLERHPEFGQGRSKMNPKSRRVRVQLLLERDGNRCYYCELEFDNENRPTIDHVRPRSKGGTNHPANLVLACSPCNNDKGSEWDDREN